MTNQWVEWGDFQTQMAKWQQSYSASSAWATKTSPFVWNIGYCHWLSSITGWEDIKKSFDMSIHVYPIFIVGYGSIPINTIFRGMNIHLPAILMWTTGVQGFDTLPVNLTQQRTAPPTGPVGHANSQEHESSEAHRLQASRGEMMDIIYHILYITHCILYV